jgi:membrane associated rhomboid family serine protease
LQFFNGFLSLAAAQRTQEAAGVAWWAHVGGFLFGAAVAAGVRWRQKTLSMQNAERRMKN